MKAVWATLVLAVVLSGCGGGADRRAQSPDATTTTTSASATSSPNAPPTQPCSSRATREAKQALRAYLDAWRRRGAVIAARRYLSPEVQLSSGRGVPHLLSGAITSCEIESVDSANRLTLAVSMDLHFRGDAGAWGEGSNDRFVTASRPNSTAPFRLAFATSP